MCPRSIGDHMGIGSVVSGWVIVMTWSWEDGRKKRHYYSIESTLDLEDNQTETELSVMSKGKPCMVDVSEMKHSARFDVFREEAG